MSRMMKWYVFSCKRLLKKPFFFLLLLILPFGMWLFHRTEEESSAEISIALFTDGDPWNEAVASNLMEEKGAFHFYISESKEALRADVAAGRAECGYCFPAGLRDKLRKRDYKRSIRTVVSPSTVTAQLASETVFAGLFRVYGRELLENYSREGAAFLEAGQSGNFEAEQGEIWEGLEPLYDKYLENGSTFAFAYETLSGRAVKEDQVTAVFPARGICAVFILVMGLGAAVTAGEDEARGLYLAMTAGRKRGCQLSGIAAAVSLAAVSVLVSFLVSETIPVISATGGKAEAVSAAAPVWQVLMREFAALFIYGAACAVFSWAILAAVRKPQMIAGLIPFFILGSLAACPVFADLSLFVPALKWVRHLFLPWYYLAL